ncbi:unnamed protein product [Vitrella brassicaformis CCMP3155]|uniref:Uncharacterized protein n=1 Tax=Vitrella brassicaformis (strain CCMP3155) TaxID=1169540 RepID=A0A0G4GYP7_VITBC|nr:unnamed protein product [Vitrella brassicaformis CCMP3155]|eukprot:CEM36331.1 unnamed protein product [Vitrella brassicaformis CCMP3155]
MVVVRLLGEASLIVRAYRQCWVAVLEANDIFESVERRVRSGLRVALAIGKVYLNCAVALLGISNIYTAWFIAWLWSPTEEFSVVGYLLRVLYVIEEGGCWDRCVSLIHYLKNSSRLLPSLPIIITAYDLQQVGSRAVFSSRPQAVRQYSLFSHRLSVAFANGRRVGLISVNGRDYLGGSADSNALTYVSIDLSDPDPPTRRGKNVFSSFTDTIAFLVDVYNEMDPRLRPHFTHPSRLITPPPTQYQLTEDIFRHTRGQWNGCRKAAYWWVDNANVLRHWGIFILFGDKAADEFLVCIDSDLWICSTEPPVASGRRPDERYPRTAARIREKVVAA